MIKIFVAIACLLLIGTLALPAVAAVEQVSGPAMGCNMLVHCIGQDIVQRCKEAGLTGQEFGMCVSGSHHKRIIFPGLVIELLP